jgi:hypothetical protein
VRVVRSVTKWETRHGTALFRVPKNVQPTRSGNSWRSMLPTRVSSYIMCACHQDFRRSLESISTNAFGWVRWGAATWTAKPPADHSRRRLIQLAKQDQPATLASLFFRDALASKFIPRRQNMRTSTGSKIGENDWSIDGQAEWYFATFLD